MYLALARRTLPACGYRGIYLRINSRDLLKELSEQLGSLCTRGGGGRLLLLQVGRERSCSVGVSTSRSLWCARRRALLAFAAAAASARPAAAAVRPRVT